jgi:polysaccharide export outer membrane protein
MIQETTSSPDHEATGPRDYGTPDKGSMVLLSRGPVVLLSCCPAVLLSICSAVLWSCGLVVLHGAEAKFAEIPGITQPATNVATAGQATTSQVLTNALAAISTNSMDALDDKHKLAIGDRLSFRIEEDQEDPKPLFVTDSGDLEVPYIGRFPAENKTCKQLAIELKATLEKEYYYRATVIIAVDVMVKTRGKVYLVGPVRMPGPVEMPSDETLTLSKAILRAGGFTDFADKRHVQVTRKGAGAADKQSFVVDVGQIFDQGKIERDLTLEPGDLIFVPERSIRF